MNVRRALAFNFLTVALDGLAGGLMIPVLPMLVLQDANSSSRSLTGLLALGLSPVSSPGC